MNRGLTILIGLLLMGMIVGVSSAEPLRPPETVFYVNSVDDDDDGTCDSTHCSLREAIKAVNNSSGSNVIIRFDFPPASVILLTPATQLPAITHPVTIDGISGTGSSCPTAASPADLKIRLDGFANPGTGTGLILAAGSDSSTIRGLNIGRFNKGIQVQADNVTIACNHIGITNDDLPGFENSSTGIELSGGSQFHQIGGSNLADRNVIAGDMGIHVLSSSHNYIANNYIGTNRLGTAALGSYAESGIFISPQDSLGSNNVIGDTGFGNVIGGYDYGITIGEESSSIYPSNNVVRSNKIGTDVTGTNPIPNGTGIRVFDAIRPTIGGSAAAGNLIAHNTGDGVYIEGSTGVNVSHNTITHNDDGIQSLTVDGVGVDIYSSNVIRNNAGRGIYLTSGVDHYVESNLIYDNGSDGVRILGGTDSYVRQNTIYGNGGDGIEIWNFASNILIRQNVIYDNDSLGIDLLTSLNQSGISQNDSLDADGGGNGQQNYPWLDSADTTGALTGTFQRSNGIFPTFTFDVYRNDTCDDQFLGVHPHGEGKEWLGSYIVDVTTTTFNWSLNLPSQPVGKFLTMTATDHNNNTSEFGNCIPITGAEYVVNDPGFASDATIGSDGCATSAGTCTLAAAVQEANAGGGASITFNLPQPAILERSTQIEVSAPIFLDGLSNPGASCATPNVHLQGQSFASGTHLLVLKTGSAGSTVRGFQISNAPEDGIQILSSDNTISCNHITDNGRAAVRIENGGDNTTITENEISNSGRHAVDIFDSDDHTIAKNEILNSGTVNNGSGIRLIRASSVTIGGTQQGDGNIIADYSGSGIYMDDNVSSVLVQHNTIGTTSSRAPVVNVFDGIHVDDEVAGVTIRDNTITENGRNGVRVDHDSSGIQILSNAILANGAQGIDLGEDGPTPTLNDVGDGDEDSGANGLQNFPVITSADANTGNVAFTLDSKPDSDMLIQLFRNTSCDGTHGEGRLLLDEMTVTTDGDGLASGMFVELEGFSADDELAATATDLDKDGTSEFSACLTATGAPPTMVTVRHQVSGVRNQVGFLLLLWFVVGGLSALLLRRQEKF